MPGESYNKTWVASGPENTPLVEFVYLVFANMPGENESFHETWVTSGPENAPLVEFIYLWIHLLVEFVYLVFTHMPVTTGDSCLCCVRVMCLECEWTPSFVDWTVAVSQGFCWCTQRNWTSTSSPPFWSPWLNSPPPTQSWQRGQCIQ